MRRFNQLAGNQFVAKQHEQNPIDSDYNLWLSKHPSAQMEEGMKDIPGSLIEDNRYCLSIHYRHVNEKDLSTLQNRVQSILKNWPMFHTTGGIKVTEIRPSIKWDKGDALKYLLETFKDISNSSKDLIPIYIGDDRTDEDAFTVLRSMNCRFPIVVNSKAKETAALYSLRDPQEVFHFLSRLATCNNGDLPSSSATTS
ncbi:probable trehalose-phosphate phosphatase D [Impatiens glandulifera]|uniref:probable trehalose-phosphate phosphatase D n=1 Tax=Impatiens glandulifera TaxID=253017 RepID=UPI001FB0E41F|nr:probable trehalose-phosphate phosphatase D [Impatiens glandulifera]